MSRWLLECVSTEDGTFFIVHRVTGNETEGIAQCFSRDWAERVMAALSWMDSADEGVFEAPKTQRPKAPDFDIVFTPAPKRRRK